MTTIETAKQRIENGEKWNKVVYTKFIGKNNVTIFIYLNGEFFKLDHVSMASYKEEKTNIENALNGINASEAATYGANYFAKGLDFAEEGENTGL